MNPRLLTALSLSALGLSLPGAQAFSVFTTGHGDIGVAYEDGAFAPHWHLHEGAVVNGASLEEDGEFAPDELLAYVPAPSLSRPEGAAWDFLGVPAGSPLWYLPQAEDPAKPFLGLATEELRPEDWSSLRLSLHQAFGPPGGQFALWQTDVLGAPRVRMATSDGVDAGDGFDLLAGSHGHFNYGFTQPGMYQLTFQWDGVHVADGPVSARGTYSFGVTVVPEPGTGALLVLGTLALLWRRRSAALPSPPAAP